MDNTYDPFSDGFRDDTFTGEGNELVSIGMWSFVGTLDAFLIVWALF